MTFKRYQYETSEEKRMQTLWDYRFAQRTQRMAGSAIRELLKITEKARYLKNS